MIGRVGYDVFGDHLKASLSAAGVDVSSVHATRSHPTGVALIWVDRAGQNSIVVASGANHALLAAEAEAMRPVFQGARVRAVSTGIANSHRVGGNENRAGEGARTMLDPGSSAGAGFRTAGRGRYSDAQRN